MVFSWLAGWMQKVMPADERLVFYPKLSDGQVECYPGHVSLSSWLRVFSGPPPGEPVRRVAIHVQTESGSSLTFPRSHSKKALLPPGGGRSKPAPSSHRPTCKCFRPSRSSGRPDTPPRRNGLMCRLRGETPSVRTRSTLEHTQMAPRVRGWV